MSGLAKSKRRTRKNLFIHIGVLCFVCYIATVLIDLQSEIVRSRQQLDAIQQSCEEQRIANKEVERMLRLGDDEEYIERVARAKSGYAYPDERIFYPMAGKR